VTVLKRSEKLACSIIQKSVFRLLLWPGWATNNKITSMSVRRFGIKFKRARIYRPAGLFLECIM
jgi:hypothetical protein